jgi:hypothetical protein
MQAFGILAAAYLAGAIAMVPWIIRGPEGRGKSLEDLTPEVA